MEDKEENKSSNGLNHS